MYARSLAAAVFVATALITVIQSSSTSSAVVSTVCSQVNGSISHPVAIDLSTRSSVLLQSHNRTTHSSRDDWHDDDDDIPSTPVPIDCSWFFATPKDSSGISLRFLQFDLSKEADDDDDAETCSVNFVEILAVNRRNESKTVAHYCGKSPLADMTIPMRNTHAGLILKASLALPSRGFKIKVAKKQDGVGDVRDVDEVDYSVLTTATTFSDNFACQPGGELLTATNGSIDFHPHQQQANNRDLECYWLFKPDASNFKSLKITLLFSDYTYDPDQSCKLPLLEIVTFKSENGAPRNQSIWTCSSWPSTDRPLTFQSTSQARLVFHGDSASNRNSFELSYSIEQESDHQNTNAEISYENNCGKSFSQVAVFDDTKSDAQQIKSNRGSWPWVAQLINQKAAFQCVATILDEDWLITAASCFDAPDRRSLSNWMVVVGRQNFNDVLAWDNSSAMIGPRIRGIFLSRQYNQQKFGNDIALVALNRSLPFNVIARPACLPDESSNGNKAELKTCAAVAYDRYVGQMVEMKAPIFNPSQCNAPSEACGAGFCAGKNIGPSNFCSENVGSPLLCLVDNRWELHGVKSLSSCQATNCGIFTKISKHVKWITSVMDYYK